jgi:hypothetical protein
MRNRRIVIHWVNNAVNFVILAGVRTIWPITQTIIFKQAMRFATENATKGTESPGSHGFVCCRFTRCDYSAARCPDVPAMRRLWVASQEFFTALDPDFGQIREGESAIAHPTRLETCEANDRERICCLGSRTG